MNKQPSNQIQAQKLKTKTNNKRMKNKTCVEKNLQCQKNYLFPFLQKKGKKEKH
jgi:hypothetical protein